MELKKFFSKRNIIIITVLTSISVFVVTAIIALILVSSIINGKNTDGDDGVVQVSTTSDEYIANSDKLLSEGKLKEALLTLYECKDELGDSDEIQKAIDDYFSRITIAPTVTPGNCDKQSCFKDTTYPEDSECTKADIGLELVDKGSGVKETIMRITLEYEESYEPTTDSVILTGKKADTVLFYTFAGAGKCSTFFYTIHTNKLQILEEGPVDWHVCDDVLIGSTLAYAVGDIVTLYAYDWQGKLLYSKKELLTGTSVKDGWLYFAKLAAAKDKYIHKFYKMKTDGTDEQQICTIETALDGYACVNGEEIVWCDAGKTNRMSLLNPYNVTLKVETDTKQENTPSWQQQTNETKQLIDKTLKHLKANYPDAGIYDLEFYADYEGVISCYIKTRDELPAYFGVEINKSSKEVTVHNMSGRIIDSFYLN